MIAAVTLNPAIDYVVRLERLRPGEINRSHGEAVQFGGKGINVARMLRTLGREDCVALGFVAGFTGEALERGIREEGLTGDFLRLPQGMTRINVKLKADGETEVNGAGPTVTPGDLDRLGEKLSALGEGDVLVLSGSLPAGAGQDTYARLLERVEGKGVLTVVDTSGEALRRALARRPWLVKPNREELGELFHETLEDEPHLLAGARRVQAMGAGNVLVSCGGDGAILLDERGMAHRAAAPAGRVVNSVGAGDSLVAGFLAGWLSGGGYDAALRLGIAAGSATAFSFGMGERDAVAACLAALEGEPLVKM